MTKLFFIGVILTFLTFAARACDCDGKPTVASEFKNSHSIFTGKVISIKPFYPTSKKTKRYESLSVEFETDSFFKGDYKKTFTVLTSATFCGYSFEKNKSYLVFGYFSDNNLHEGVCGRTAELKDALTEINELKEIIKTSPNNGFKL